MKKILFPLLLIFCLHPLWGQNYTSIDQVLTKSTMEKYYKDQPHKYQKLEKKYAPRIKSADIQGVTPTFVEALLDQELDDYKRGDVNFTYRVDISGLNPQEVCEVVALMRAYPALFMMFGGLEALSKKSELKDKYNYKLNISAYESIMRQGNALDVDQYDNLLFKGKKPKGYGLMKLMFNKTINTFKSEMKEYNLVDDKGTKKVELKGKNDFHIKLWIDKPNSMIIYIE